MTDARDAEAAARVSGSCDEEARTNGTGEPPKVGWGLAQADRGGIVNEEAREKAWWRFSDARQAPRIADSRADSRRVGRGEQRPCSPLHQGMESDRERSEIFESGWAAARTFSAEDVERVAKVLANREMGKWDLYLDDARAALAAIGTVEEAQ